MEQQSILVKSKKWLWLPFAIYAILCFAIPVFFSSSWLEWTLEAVAMLLVGGERLLRSMARKVYRRLKEILPEHTQEIQAYQNDLHVFKRNIMVKPDFVEPLMMNYPQKNTLVSELRLLYKLSRGWEIAGNILIVIGCLCMLALAVL